MGLYEECSDIFQRLGFNTSTAINIFFTYVSRENGIPFADMVDSIGSYGSTVSRTVKIDESLYNEAKTILKSQDYTLSQAVNFYFETVKETKGIPFPLKLKE